MCDHAGAMGSLRNLANVRAVLGLALYCLSWLAGGATVALAEEKERWNAPFGGAFSATFTVASDYSFAGISQTKLGPAVQTELGYRTREFSADLPVWFYATAWGSNINFPTTGVGVEVDLAAGFKTRLLDRKLSIDVGYIRYTFLGRQPISLQLRRHKPERIRLRASRHGRLRFSSDSSALTFPNKRALLTVPLLSHRSENILQNHGRWQHQLTVPGLPFRAGVLVLAGRLVTSVYGFDVSVAYTDTSDRAGGLHDYCATRVRELPAF